MAVNTAVILLGHGSRDPVWCQPMQAMAQALNAANARVPAVCAYLELCEPAAEDAAAMLLAQYPGLQRLVVYPVFIGMGLHLREDLPELAHALQARFPHLDVHFAPALGMDDRLIALVADRVQQTCAALSQGASKPAVP